MTIDSDTIHIGLEALTIMGVVGNWLATRHRATNARIDQLQADHSDRLTRLESTVASAPTHDHLGEIYERIAGIEQATAGNSATLVEIRESVRTVINYLTQRGLEK
jgi:hypothetical protein